MVTHGAQTPVSWSKILCMTHPTPNHCLPQTFLALYSNALQWCFQKGCPRGNCAVTLIPLLNWIKNPLTSGFCIQWRGTISIHSCTKYLCSSRGCLSSPAPIGCDGITTPRRTCWFLLMVRCHVMMPFDVKAVDLLILFHPSSFEQHSTIVQSVQFERKTEG